MRHILLLAPRHRRGYTDSALLDAKARGDMPTASRATTDEAYLAASMDWLDMVQAVAVYDDLPMTEAMRRLIARAEALGVPVEHRQLPVERLSVLDRMAIAA